ncbi:hypothetical protein GOP47_0022354 [Adiantum capillus-veneris]|uniref:Uncharacterized protein n=1 Tax=Adiantum capillus-veneris TaxID=13818 RepID=A0A9D4U658_ADICA|nr:hypothetical protein GOP47_0022354 [Adiantum capillus-veneris]
MEYHSHAKLAGVASTAPAVELVSPAPSRDVEKVADEEHCEGEVLDWLGRPATEKHGGPKTSLYILGNQALWNVANFAVASNLVMYFNRVLHMSNATAANNVTNWTGTMWLCTLLGGFMGDSYWGRFWTCVIFQIVHILGLVGLSLSVTVDALKPANCAATAVASCPKVSALQTAVFFVAIYIIALGSGGYLPAFTALGADQFESAIDKTNFFGWLFFATNVGTILANTLFVWMENRGMWALSYWLATALGGLAFLAFGLGVPVYRQFRPAGNAFTRVAQVLVAFLRKYRLEVPNDPSLLHELNDKELILHGCRRMQHTSRFRCLDKAATKDAEDNKGGRSREWRLCSVTQVEEVKQLWRMLPIFLMAVPFAAIFSQGTTLFVEQAAAMDTKVGGFSIPPAAMNVLNTMSIFVMTLVYPMLVVPAARRVTRKKEGLGPLQRMAVGIVISSLGMACASMLESRRLHLRAHGRALSILWQTPQQVILGAASVFVVVGAMDFFYSEAPHAMRGIVSSLSLTNLAIGNYASTLLVSLTVRITSRDGGKTSWIPPDLNKGHLDYFFALLFVLSLLSAALFVVCAWWYHRAPTLVGPRPTPITHEPLPTALQDKTYKGK